MSLTDRETHFEFGENWKAYSRKIDRARIDFAVEGLLKLFPEGLAGKSFLDIGCGSGLHALAALRLGAASVLAIDLDENSVATTRQLLSERSPGADWRADIVSIFEASPDKLGTFDVVYSWGVLHHTGDMWRAIGQATTLVKPGGRLAIAIYAASPLDPFWKAEKAFYTRAPRAVQWLIRHIYMGAFIVGKTAQGKNPLAFLRDYSRLRGMDFPHDAHDWLGGYPYEAAGADELAARVTALGFTAERSFVIVPKLKGLFGSGCSEFVFIRRIDE